MNGWRCSTRRRPFRPTFPPHSPQMSTRRDVRRTCNPYTGLPELEIIREVELDPDPCLVETAPLASCLKEFISDYRDYRPSLAGRRRRLDELTSPDIEPVGPYQQLAFTTGLPEDTIRKVRNADRNPYTEMRVADALIAAGIGDEAMLAWPDPTLQIVQNERSTLRCDSCGGSSTVA